MNCRVLYSYWQMECCGDPFKPGDTVKWLVRKDYELSVSGDVDIGELDYVYDAHDHTINTVLTGVVMRIWGLYEEYLTAENSALVPVRGEFVEFSDSKSAKRVPRVGALEISAYVVELENCSISRLGKDKTE